MTTRVLTLKTLGVAAAETWILQIVSSWKRPKNIFESLHLETACTAPNQSVMGKYAVDSAPAAFDDIAQTIRSGATA
jgi:hypothetical protein